MRTNASLSIAAALVLLLAFAGGARAQSIYTGHILVGSPHAITNDVTGPVLLASDACQDADVEGFHSNCIALAPEDQGLPLVRFSLLALSSTGTGIRTPCVYSPEFTFYDVSGAPLSFDRHFVPLGAVALAVTLASSTCADIQWTLVLGFE